MPYHTRRSSLTLRFGLTHALYESFGQLAMRFKYPLSSLGGQAPLRMTGRDNVRLCCTPGSLPVSEQAALLTLLDQVVVAAQDEVAARGLRPGRHISGMRWHLLVMPSTQLRAVAGTHTAAADSPGVIMLSTELIGALGGLGSPEGRQHVQAIIAHEVAHMVCGHQLDTAMGRVRLLLRRAVPMHRDGSDGGLPGPVPDLWLATSLAQKGQRCAQEWEADEMAAFVQARAGVHPEKAASALELLARAAQASDEEMDAQLAGAQQYLLAREHAYTAAVAAGQPRNPEVEAELAGERRALLEHEAVAVHPPLSKRIQRLRELANDPVMLQILQKRQQQQKALQQVPVAAAMGMVPAPASPLERRQVDGKI